MSTLPTINYQLNHSKSSAQHNEESVPAAPTPYVFCAKSESALSPNDQVEFVKGILVSILAQESIIHTIEDTIKEERCSDASAVLYNVMKVTVADQYHSLMNMLLLTKVALDKDEIALMLKKHIPDQSSILLSSIDSL
jgi:hypothetical protein